MRSHKSEIYIETIQFEIESILNEIKESDFLNEDNEFEISLMNFQSFNHLNIFLT